MKKIALLLVLVLIVLWLSGCMKRSSPTFIENDMLYNDCHRGHTLWESHPKTA